MTPVLIGSCTIFGLVGGVTIPGHSGHPLEVHHVTLSRPMFKTRTPQGEKSVSLCHCLSVHTSRSVSSWVETEQAALVAWFLQ